MERAPASLTTKHCNFRRFGGVKVHVSIESVNLPMISVIVHPLTWTRITHAPDIFQDQGSTSKVQGLSIPLTWTLREAKNFTLNVHVS